MKKRYKEATNVLSLISRWNGKSDKISSEEIESEIKKLANDEIEITKLNESTMFLSKSTLNIGSNHNNQNDFEQKSNQKPTLAYYLTHPFRNLTNTILLSYVWMSLAVIYFGMIIGKLELNIFR